jgi:hypothetical protein
MKTFTIEATFGDQVLRSLAPVEHQLTSAALVWLAATGQHGTKLTELMKLGDMSIGFDITRISATAFNFRMSVDKKTLAKIRGSAN